MSVLTDPALINKFVKIVRPIEGTKYLCVLPDGTQVDYTFRLTGGLSIHVQVEVNGLRCTMGTLHTEEEVKLWREAVLTLDKRAFDTDLEQRDADGEKLRQLLVTLKETAQG